LKRTCSRTCSYT